MRIANALKEKLMDVRLRDKLIAEGKVTKEEVEKYLHELEDQTTKLLYTDQVETQSGNEAGAVRDSQSLDQ